MRDRWSDATAHRWALVALLGAILVVGGSATHFAMSYPPYGIDEASHVGYALSLEDGDLPDIDTRLPAGHEPMFNDARRRNSSFFPRDVFVANNPPFPYVAAIPFIEVAELAGASPLFGFRLFAVTGAVAAVGCAFLLGRELSGGSWFTGSVTAGLLAGVTSLVTVTAWASLDGPALAATTGLTWAVARYARTRSTSAAWWIGGWCALAAAVRPMSMVFAVAAGAITLVLGWRARGWRAVPPLTVRVAGPSVVLVCWFYVLNIARYGDPTGSRALFDKFNLKPRMGLLSAILDARTFVNPLSFLLRERYTRWLVYDPGILGPLIALAFGAVLGAAYLLARRSAASAPDAGDVPIDVDGGLVLVPSAWLSAIALCPVPVVLISQHYADGGGYHPRYLLPLLPVLAAALALLLARINRWLAVLAVTVVVTIHLTRTPAAGDSFRATNSILGPEFDRSLIDDGAQQLTMAVAVIGAAILIGALGMSIRAPQRRSRERESPASSGAGDTEEPAAALS